MKKGISFYFGCFCEPKERAKLIKEIGFDFVITSADPSFNYQNGNIKQQIKWFKKAGLKLSSLHNRYKSIELPKFWEEGKVGDKLEKNLVKDVLLAKKYEFKCVVVHLFGKTSDIGYARIDRVLNVCRRKNIPLAIENIDDQPTFVEVMEHYKNEPLIRFCYDSGHNHCFDPEFDYLTKYMDKLICLHLHDNLGDIDAHTLNKFGNINWDNIAKKLAKAPEDICLDYELLISRNLKQNVKPENLKEYVKVGKMSKEQVLKECFKDACELETKILKYKNNKQNKIIVD